MYLIGYDIGSSSVKACVVDAQTGKTLSTAFYPKQEAPILSLKAGWAEQEPESWWNYLKSATAEAMAAAAEKAGRPISALKEGLAAIGISYQMHGLVCVDRTQKALRPAIIWCDSRAVPYGQKAMETLGADFCLIHLLNSPGNFTASKLAWVKEHEPEVYEKIDKVMLPGDYIAMRLTGTACTTVSGLSEGMFWDFKHNCVCKELMEYYGFSMDLIPEIRPTFSEQGRVTETVAEELGIKAGIPVTYRAGDQPNNALSLNVFNPGEIASTAGTSGVVYGVNGTVNYDPLSRVNTFAHVNHAAGTYNRIPRHGTDAPRRIALHQRHRYSEFMGAPQCRTRRIQLRRDEPHGRERARGQRRPQHHSFRQRSRACHAKQGNGLRRAWHQFQHPWPQPHRARRPGRHCLLFPLRHRRDERHGHGCEQNPRRTSQHVPQPPLPRHIGRSDGCRHRAV